MTEITAIKNPYLQEFERLELGYNGFASWMATDGSSKLEHRYRLVKQYAWAVPNDEAIRAIVKHSPIIEIGAGSGYWASLISQAGGVIFCYDDGSRQDDQGQWIYEGQQYHTVNRGNQDVLANGQYDDHALMLCWPEYGSSDAHDALCNYRGQTVIYIGEGYGGCTGDDAFHEALEHDFELTNSVAIPRYWGIRDRLEIYRRKP